MRAVAATPAPEVSVEPVVAPPPGNPRFPLVDGLRAVAALSVVVFHGAYLSGATSSWYGHFVGRLELGVALFFAISGFLLYRPFFAAHYAGRPPIRTRDYLRRRVLRIVPAYWLALTALAIWPGLVGVFTGDWWVYYGFLQIYELDTFFLGIQQSWSLCVEATFYLVLPLYALVLRKVCRARAPREVVRIEIGVLVVLAVAALAYRTLAVASGSTVAFIWLPGMFDWFAPGMALAVVSVVIQEGGRDWRPARLIAKRPAALVGIAGALFVVLALVASPPVITGTSYTQWEYFAIHVFSGAIAILLLLPAVIGADRASAVRRFLSLPLLAWLGLISYGIYLWHHTLMAWLYGKGVADWLPGLGFVVLTVVALALTLICAAASYYVVERPILRFKDPRRRRAD